MDGLILAAQRLVNETLLVDRLASDANRARAQAIYRLARLALKHLPDDSLPVPRVVQAVVAEGGGQLPELENHHQGNDPHSTALGTAVACVVLDAAHPASDEVLAWLMNADLVARRPRAVISWLQRVWVPAGPSVAGRAAAQVDAELPFRTRVRHGTPNGTPSWVLLAGDQAHRRASRMPAMLWPSWTMRLLAAETEGAAGSLAGFRRTCSILMLLHSSSLDQQQAADLLGITRPGAQRLAFDKMVGGTEPTLLITMLVLLARALDQTEPPIDYARRRAVFAEPTLTFDEQTYRQLCRARGQYFSERRLASMRWHLLKLLHGSDPGDLPRTPARPVGLRHSLTVEFVEFLAEQAADNLAAHGIHEPVQWEPPAHWIDQRPWPGADPQNVDPGAILVGRQGLKCLTFNIDDALLQLCQEGTGFAAPPPTLRQRKPRPRGVRVPRTGALAPDQLREFHENQGLEQKQIALLAGCSPTTVHNALREAQIPLRERRRPHSLEHSVDPDWIRTEYHTKGRKAADIARELGVDKNSVLALMRVWNIPRTLRYGSYSNPFAAIDQSLSPALKRVSSTKNCRNRLQHILQMPGHRNLSSAAAALGIDPGCLGHQVRGIEAAAGFAIIVRTSPLSVTSEGHLFLTEAKRALEQCDGTRGMISMPSGRP